MHADEAHVSKTTPPIPWWAANSAAPYLSRAHVSMIGPRGTLTALVVALCFVAGLWTLLVSTAPQETVHEPGGLLAHQQSNDALIGGCGPLYSFEEPTANSGTVPDKTTTGVSNRLGYPTTVPMRGQFWDSPVDKHVWRPDEAAKPVAEQLLRNMWDGDMVVYYSHLVPEKDVEALSRLARLQPDLHLYVVPWEQRLRGPLPRGRSLAFATWNTSQTCHTLSLPALGDFREAAPTSGAPGADGTRPPVLQQSPPIAVTVE